MMRHSTISMLSFLLFFLAACVAAPIMAGETELCKKISEIQDQTAFFVAYSKDTGEPIKIIESPSFYVKKQVTFKDGEKSIKLEDLVPLLQELGKDEKFFDTISSPTLFLHGSPGCYIKTSTGGWKCICPR